VLPFRIQHGSVRSTLQWDSAPSQCDVESILPLCMEGLREVEHPYVFLAREAGLVLLGLAASDDTDLDGIPGNSAAALRARVIAILPQLMAPLRAALAEPQADMFSAALRALVALSSATGAAFNAQLGVVLAPLNRRMMDRTRRDAVQQVLEVLERNGGAPATKIIKAKVPTYTSVL
jgi:hypothetical protein